MINYYRTNTTKQNKNTHRNWICVQVPIWGVMSILSLQICTSEHSPLEVCTIYDFLYKKNEMEWNKHKKNERSFDFSSLFPHISTFVCSLMPFCSSLQCWSLERSCWSLSWSILLFLQNILYRSPLFSYSNVFTHHSLPLLCVPF